MLKTYLSRVLWGVMKPQELEPRGRKLARGGMPQKGIIGPQLLPPFHVASWLQRGEQVPWSHTLSLTHGAAVHPNTTGWSERGAIPLIPRASRIPAFAAVYHR